MPQEIEPAAFQNEVHRGYRQLKNFRKARQMFIRQYVGPYYNRMSGTIGDESLAMIFNAVRVLIPNIVMNFPTHKVESRFLAYKEYAELLALTLSHHDKVTSIRDIYRSVLVDAVFTLGIMKTGLCESDSAYALDEASPIDPGTVFTETVDFDNFVVDPSSRDFKFRDAFFMGDKIRVPRTALLDSGLYKNALVENLPSAQDTGSRKDKAADLSRTEQSGPSGKWLDNVEICELWVPSAHMLVTVPADESVVLEDFLRVDDYYGPDSGPYTLLSLTPPVPGNPLPVPTVGVLHDLHVLGNRMARKIVDQAQRQKDILGYKRAAADDAKSVIDASDGDSVAMDDPDGAKTFSFGGQQRSNEVHLESLRAWFNQLAANPEQLAGLRFDANSATQANLMQQNASVGLEDMKDMLYQAAAQEASKRAWYFHTDPLINMPLIRRTDVAQPPIQGPMGPIPMPSIRADEQVFLTPEARRGDWLDFMFSIEPESMGRRDSASRFASAMEFAVKILPAVMQAATAAQALGLPFNPKAMVIRMAQDHGITWMEEIFNDPEYGLRMLMLMQRGPSAEASKGQLQPNGGLGATLQNGQPGQVMGGPVSDDTQQRQDAQAGANESQAALKGSYSTQMV